MDTRVQVAIRYLEEHIDETVPLEDVANHVSLSPFHFHRLFRKEMGEPFYAYAKRVRMMGAAAQLEATSDNLLEIAMAFGYGSNAAFSRAFTAYFGCCPSTYRQEMARRRAYSPSRQRAMAESG